MKHPDEIFKLYKNDKLSLQKTPLIYSDSLGSVTRVEDIPDVLSGSNLYRFEGEVNMSGKQILIPDQNPLFLT